MNTCAKVTYLVLLMLPLQGRLLTVGLLLQSSLGSHRKPSFPGLKDTRRFLFDVPLRHLLGCLDALLLGLTDAPRLVRWVV